MEVKHVPWHKLRNGYHQIYNPLPKLEQYETKKITLNQLLKEFWEELHHQGDVDSASYAVVPMLTLYYQRGSDTTGELLTLLVTIILASKDKKNPKPSGDVKRYFDQATDSLVETVASSILRPKSAHELWSALSLISLQHKQIDTAKLLNFLDQDTLKHIVDEYT